MRRILMQNGNPDPGRDLVRQGRLDDARCRRLAEPVRLSGPKRLLYRGMKRAGLTDLYWNSNLKKHGAMARRDDKPYAP